MLVVSRKSHQQIRIGDAITVTILRVRGSGVRVGIEAPPDVPIARSELDSRPRQPARRRRGNSDGGPGRGGRNAGADRPATPAFTGV